MTKIRLLSLWLSSILLCFRDLGLQVNSPRGGPPIIHPLDSSKMKKNRPYTHPEVPSNDFYLFFTRGMFIVSGLSCLRVALLPRGPFTPARMSYRRIPWQCGVAPVRPEAGVAARATIDILSIVGGAVQHLVGCNASRPCGTDTDTAAGQMPRARHDYPA